MTWCLVLQVVQAQSTTGSPMNKTMSNHTMGPTASVNTTTAKSGSGRTDAFTLLLPLALGASLLHGWSWSPGLMAPLHWTRTAKTAGLWTRRYSESSSLKKIYISRFSTKTRFGFDQSSCRYFGMFERSAARCSGGPVLLFSAGALHGLNENSPFPINYRCLLLGGW